MASFFLLGLFIFRFKMIFEKKVGLGNEVVGIISNEPEISGNTQSFFVNGIKIVTFRRPEYHYGNYIKFQIPISKSQTNPKSQILMIFYPKITLIETQKGNYILSRIYEFRGRIVEIYQRVLPEPMASLLTGIVLGVKSSLPYDFNEALRNTGVIHVVVASGTNITFVVVFLIFIFNRFFNRRLAILLSFLGIIFYSAMAGFQAPIVRASLMALTVLSSQILGRQSFGLLSLTFAVLMMLFINPLYIQDVGFQLSVMATLGLLAIGPIFKRWKFFSIPFIGEDLKTTLSAQIMVLPILLFSFGKVSILSPIVNALVLWVIPPVMILGFVIAVLGLIYFPLAQIVSYFAYGFLFYFVEMVRFFGKIEWGKISIENPSGFLALGYYLILIGLIIFFVNRKNLEIKRKNNR